MTTNQAYQILENKQQRNIFVIACLLLLTLLTIGLDFLFSQIQNTSFYISESLLFGSFWLLFFPLLNIQFDLTKRSKKISVGIFIASVMITIHLFAYPVMVLFLSKFFYNHTFPYWQTFNFQLTEHFIKLIIIYFLPLPIILIYQNKLLKKQVIEKTELSKQNFITSLIVSNANNKKIVIDTNEILYFSANSPYINIHHPVKRYLYSDTLKSLQIQLDNDQFIRIHKSYIVNISKVISYQSRLNGDYDLLLSDNTTLRVSRNYAATFKSAFEPQHRLTT